MHTFSKFAGKFESIVYHNFSVNSSINTFLSENSEFTKRIYISVA